VGEREIAGLLPGARTHMCISRCYRHGHLLVYLCFASLLPCGSIPPSVANRCAPGGTAWDVHLQEINRAHAAGSRTAGWACTCLRLVGGAANEDIKSKKISRKRTHDDARLDECPDSHSGGEGDKGPIQTHTQQQTGVHSPRPMTT
jgi:hypothetical protein